MSFKPIDINTLIKIFVESLTDDRYKTVCNLSKNKIFKGYPDVDMSVKFHIRKASTPVGPAAGPHSQLAQNIVISWLAGSRIIELKTIQINDNIEIPKPCIDAPNVCFNVEFSQELTLEESLREYVKAYILIEIIKAEKIIDFHPNSTDTIFELSIGYNLKGITTNKIRNYINGLKDSFLIIEDLKNEIEIEKYKNMEFNPHIVNSITLSTFHGCPPDEIEQIGEFLLKEMNINTTIKINPTSLGKQKLYSILYDTLEYHHIRINENAYLNDIGFSRACDIANNLNQIAIKNGLSFGLKFTNTLEVINNKTVFKDKVMYMSGEPLHLIAINLMHQFREKVDKNISFSFSAGISEHNFSDTVSLNLIPITVCTDLLRPGGYGKIFNYLENFYQKLKKYNSSNINEYILKRYKSPNEGLFEASIYNTEKYIEKLNEDSYYNYDNNSKIPLKKDIELKYFNCSGCGKCVQVCPNGANFIYKTTKQLYIYNDFVLAKSNTEHKLREFTKKEFAINKTVQIANYIDACNECGNCETFCPEKDGPYKKKPKIYSSKENFDKTDSKDNVFYISNNRDTPTIYAKVKNREYSLTINKELREASFIVDNLFILIFNFENHHFERVEFIKEDNGSHTINMSVYYKMFCLLKGIISRDNLNFVNINEKLGDNTI